MRLARTKDSGNAEASAVVAEDVLLGGARGEVRCHVFRCQVSSYGDGIGKSSMSFESQSSEISKPFGGL